MILVDTSVWIELLRGTIRVDWELMEEFAICGPVMQEILQGLGDTREALETRRMIGYVTVLGDPIPLDAFEEAAEIYRGGSRSRRWPSI